MEVHKSKGLKLAELRVSDRGIVQYQGVNGWVNIGRYDTLVDLHGDPYIDENGIEIDLKKKIENLLLTEAQFRNLIRAEFDDSDEFSERLGVFNHILLNALRGVADPTRRTK